MFCNGLLDIYVDTAENIGGFQVVHCPVVYTHIEKKAADHTYDLICRTFKIEDSENIIEVLIGIHMIHNQYCS